MIVCYAQNKPGYHKKLYHNNIDNWGKATYQSNDFNELTPENLCMLIYFPHGYEIKYKTNQFQILDNKTDTYYLVILLDHFNDNPDDETMNKVNDALALIKVN